MQMIAVNRNEWRRDGVAERFDLRPKTPPAALKAPGARPPSFRVGRRGCIGQHIALTELDAALDALSCHGATVTAEAGSSKPCPLAPLLLDRWSLTMSLV
jgi:cytochrome P450